MADAIQIEGAEQPDSGTNVARAMLSPAAKNKSTIVSSGRVDFSAISDALQAELIVHKDGPREMLKTPEEPFDALLNAQIVNSPPHNGKTFGELLAEPAARKKAKTEEVPDADCPF